MSYIHDALKKAQKDKDRGDGSYDGVVSSKKGERSLSSSTWILISFAFLSLLTLTIFSWRHRPHTTNPIQEKIRPDRMALEKPVAKKKEDAETIYLEIENKVKKLAESI